MDQFSDLENILIQQSDANISSLMGKPDETELYERSEKFFFYQLDCTDDFKKASYLRIRFNALGYAKEVLIIRK